MRPARGIMRIVHLTATAALLATLGLDGPPLRVRQASADGALAVGLPADVARQGVAMGWAINFSSRQEAQAQAMKDCRNFKDAPEATRSLCKVVESFRGQCVAIALDPELGTPGVGWAVAGAQPAAEGAAMAACVASAGRDRQKNCEVAVAKCDGR
jgi:Domain of unknown function (DUF4189)